MSRGAGDRPLTYAGPWVADRTFQPREVVKHDDVLFLGMARSLGVTPDPNLDTPWFPLGGDSSGGVLSTASTVTGLPSFAGRSEGDFHHDIPAGKQYVLTGVGGGGGDPLSDNFNVGAADTNLSAPWVQRQGTLRYVGDGRVYCTSASGGPVTSMASRPTSSSDGQSNIQSGNAAGNVYAGVRVNSATEFYYADFFNKQIRKCIAGVHTTLITWAGNNPGINGVCSLSIVGSLLTAYSNGVQVAQVTDTSIASGANFGFGCTSTFNPTDNWSYGVAQGTLQWRLVGRGITAADVVNVPAGSLVATNVQAALAELDAEKAAAHSHVRYCLSTVGPVLPDPATRFNGDFHRLSTTGVTYELADETVPAATDTFEISGATYGYVTVNGKDTETGAKTWVTTPLAGGGDIRYVDATQYPGLVGRWAHVLTSSCLMGFDMGSGDHDLSFEWKCVVNSDFGTMTGYAIVKGGFSTGYRLEWTTNAFTLYRNNVQVASAVVPGLSTAYNSSTWPSGRIRLSCDVATKTITAYHNDVAFITYVDATVLTGTALSVGGGVALAFNDISVSAGVTPTWYAVGGGGGSLAVQDENVAVASGVNLLDFQGAGVSAAAGAAGEVIVTIPGGGGADDQTAAEVPFTPTGAIAATDVQAALAELDTEKSGTGHGHAAQTAAQTPYSGSTNLSATDVEAALDELDAEKAALGHTHPADDDQTAAQVPFTPAGAIGSGNVQAALEELDAEKAAAGHTHAATGVAVQDENVAVASGVTTFDFQGPGVAAAAGAAGEVIVTVQGGLQTRTTAAYTTAVLAVAARETGVLALHPGYRLLKVQFSDAGRVRLYTTTGKRDTDLARAPGVDPGGNSGLMLDYVATAAGTFDLSPLVDGFVDSGTDVPLTIDNTGAASTAITVTLTYIRTE